jgi:hypothetical protein
MLKQKKKKIESKIMARKSFLIVLFFLLIIPSQKIAFLTAGPAGKKTVQVNREISSVANIIDPELIQIILDQCLIPESDVVKMEVIDVNQNGFGEKDIARLSPSGNVYVLEKISTEVQNIMDAWGFQANFQISGANRVPATYDSIETDRAQYSIFSTLLRGLNRNYHDFPIKIRFERDSVGVIFEMWGFNPEHIEHDNPEPFMPDSVITYDIFHVFHDDTLINFDNTLFDVIHVYYQNMDTVYVGRQTQKSQFSTMKSKE